MTNRTNQTYPHVFELYSTLPLQVLNYIEYVHGRWHFNEIRAIFSRLYLLQNVAIEIFMANRSKIFYAKKDIFRGCHYENIPLNWQCTPFYNKGTLSTHDFQYFSSVPVLHHLLALLFLKIWTFFMNILCNTLVTSWIIVCCDLLSIITWEIQQSQYRGWH